MKIITKLEEHPYCKENGHKFVPYPEKYHYDRYIIVCERCGIDRRDLGIIYALEIKEEE